MFENFILNLIEHELSLLIIQLETKLKLKEVLLKKGFFLKNVFFFFKCSLLF